MKPFVFALALLPFSIASHAQKPVTPAAKVSFTTFISQDGRFSALLPARPKASTQPVKEGSDGPQHIYLVETATSAYYISYVDYKPDLIKSTPVEKMLDGARDGGVENAKGKLVSEKHITLNGFPGRETLISLPGAEKVFVRARFYIVDVRMYMLIYSGTKETVTSASADTFLTSLILNKKLAVPELWPVVEVPDAHFKINMPAKPMPSEEDVSPGQKVHMYVYSDDKSQMSYFAAYNKLPDALPNYDNVLLVDHSLDAGVDALLKSFHATIDSKRYFSLQGNPGYDTILKISVQGAPADAGALLRTLIVKDTYYQLLIVGTKKAIADGHADAFFDSFELTPTETAAKPK